MELNLSKLSSAKLKELSKVVDIERKRRGKRSPDKHEPPVWSIPRDAVHGTPAPRVVVRVEKELVVVPVKKPKKGSGDKTPSPSTAKGPQTVPLDPQIGLKGF